MNSKPKPIMTNKEKAISFLTLAGTGMVQEAYDAYMSPDFIHHNQYFAGDRESLKVAMEEAHQNRPNTGIEVKKVYEEGLTVITHSHVVKTDMEIAVVHIFRFEEGKIVELWDLGQVMDANSPNENGAF